MKRSSLVLLMFFLSIGVFSQINKGDILISGYGNYNESLSESGTYKNNLSVEGKYLEVGTSLGYFLSKKIVVGFGVDYMSTKEDRVNSTALNVFHQSDEIIINSHALLPTVYLGYYYQLVNKLYISGNLKVSYGKLKSDYETIFSGYTDLITEGTVVLGDGDYDYYTSYYGYVEDASNVDYLRIQLLPELTYFISSRFSLNLGLGGVEYAETDWNSNSSEWNVSFNPSYWKLGFKIRI